MPNCLTCVLNRQPMPSLDIPRSVPRYFFHLRDDLRVNDEEGRLLPDEGVALSTALEEARVLVCESIRQHGNVNMDHSIVVTDETGSELFTVTFREAFTVTGEPVRLS